MMKELRRLLLVSRHLQFNLSKCAYSTPTISVSPSTAMIDEKVDIVVTGLKPNQTVTLVAKTEENQNKFQSRCVVRADESGRIHNFHTPSIAGTFTGVQPMGLFWSLTPNSGVRLMKKDVASAIKYNIEVYDGSQSDAVLTNSTPLTTTNVSRFFKKPGVKRIPLENGRFKGTIFVPEGDGPFPALVDMFGGLVTLIETRAALLASHGYATFALSYLYGEGLPQTLLSTDLDYINEAADWFSHQEYVDENRFGAFGICFGGTLGLYMATVSPKVKVVVNINGIPMHGGQMFDQEKYNKNDKWPRSKRVYHTHEGVVINDVYQVNKPVYIPAWQHGAKVLQISGEDDKQVHPKWHRCYEQNWPEEWKSNFELVTYPGAGHLIEPPYTPLCRAVNAGRKRMSTIDFVPPEFYDEPLIAGGYPGPHAFAQEDSWERILRFLDKNLRNIEV